MTLLDQIASLILRTSTVQKMEFDRTANILTVMVAELDGNELVISHDSDGMIHEATNDGQNLLSSASFDDLAEYTAWVEEG